MSPRSTPCCGGSTALLLWGRALAADGKLPPHALDATATDHPEQALTQELQRIGVIRRVDDERVGIPDLFRVAAKIGRRGGVRPIR